MKLRRPKKDIWTACIFLVVVCLLGFAIFWAWRTYITTPPYVDPERFPVRGIDLSAHNGYANLNAAADAGYEFVFLKASEGATFHDSNFALNYQKARHAGMKIGAYHFFRFDRDGVEQAMNFLKAIGPRPLELGLAIDVEETGNARNVPLDSINVRLQQMLDYLNLKGHRVTFYSNRAGYEKYLLDNFRGFPLWVCTFTDNSAQRDWIFWQFDHRGKVPGIRGDVDLNVFSGTREEWEAFLRDGTLPR